MLLRVVSSMMIRADAEPLIEGFKLHSQVIRWAAFIVMI